MPKDAKKNVDRYKVRGGDLNKYDFEENKTAERSQDTADKAQLKPEGQKPPKPQTEKPEKKR